jgi:hypothetical protein
VLRLEVELRDKHVPQNRRGNKSKAAAVPQIGGAQGSALMVPMEKVYFGGSVFSLDNDKE